jgi:acetyl-CoA carboxylase biotin carboxyl carrier protein
MTEQQDPTSETLAELREHTRKLATDLAGPLRRVRVRSGDTTIEVEWQTLVPAAPPLAGYPQPTVSVWDGTAADGQSVTGVVEQPDEHAMVGSPMVGTFYRANSPSEPPFVEVGDFVQEGQTVGVVEAMKLFNPITAECAGIVTEVLVGDAEPVEFGQALIRLAVDRDAIAAVDAANPSR